ncbi:MAG: hypothetical protein KC425_14290, partial [Anaerolineales bacterium]|nr:hypothetical protein [Anaerolineales bacterium]
GALLLGGGLLSLLLALTLGQQRGFGDQTVWLLLGGALLLLAAYPQLLFVDNTPERQRTWAENRPRLYPTTWDAPPQFGLFGFPHQAGWRALSGRETAVSLPYASNEEEEITNWYMRQAPRTHCADAGTFVLATQVQDVVPYDAAWVAGLAAQGQVLVNGRTGLTLYGETAVAAPFTVDGTAVAGWWRPEDVAPPPAAPAYPLQATLGDGAVRLLGYDVDDARAEPGGQVTVVLVWEALKPLEQNYQVFTHLYDGTLWAQHDGAPECGIMPTTRWEPGQIIVDPHVIDLPAEMPRGEMPLLVGMYGLISGERLRVQETGADVVPLAPVRVR